jgi:hypothetical protein
VVRAVLAATNPYGVAVVGLVGSLVGGLIAGTVSLLVARQTRDAAERSWIRDSRRDIYDRFLTRAQQTACRLRRVRRDTPRRLNRDSR